MHLKTLRLDRVFDVVAGTLHPETATAGRFSFESNGKRYFGITAYGVPCPQAGHTMTALPELPDDRQSLLGLIIHETQAISYHLLQVAMGLYVWLALVVTAQIFKRRKICRLLRPASRAESG